MSIDGIPFNLDDAGNGIAVSKSSLEDIRLLGLLLEGSQLLIYSRSFDGRYTVDSYSLDGLEVVYSNILGLC